MLAKYDIKNWFLFIWHKQVDSEFTEQIDVFTVLKLGLKLPLRRIWCDCRTECQTDVVCFVGDNSLLLDGVSLPL